MKRRVTYIAVLVGVMSAVGPLAASPMFSRGGGVSFGGGMSFSRSSFMSASPAMGFHASRGYYRIPAAHFNYFEPSRNPVVWRNAGAGGGRSGSSLAANAAAWHGYPASNALAEEERGRGNAAITYSSGQATDRQPVNRQPVRVVSRRFYPDFFAQCLGRYLGRYGYGSGYLGIGGVGYGGSYYPGLYDVPEYYYGDVSPDDSAASSPAPTPPADNSGGQPADGGGYSSNGANGAPPGMTEPPPPHSASLPPEGDSLTESVQAELARRGYFPGTIDGVLGPDTEEALRRFQGDMHLRVSGHVNQATLFALGLN